MRAGRCQYLQDCSVVLGVLFPKRAAASHKLLNHILVAAINSIEQRGVANNVDIIQRGAAGQQPQHRAQAAAPRGVVDGIALALGVLVAVGNGRALLNEVRGHRGVALLAGQQEWRAAVQAVNRQKRLAALGKQMLNS